MRWQPAPVRLGLRRVVGLLVLAMIVLAAAALPLRDAVAALLLLPHFFPGDAPRPLLALTGAPVRSTIAVADAPGVVVADVYVPAGQGPFPAMILLLGVNPLPRTHEQVVTLADGIARTGIATFVAESTWLLNGEIRVEEIDNLVRLFEVVEAFPGIDPARVGFSGFCIGAVLQLLAASDPRIADRVSYVHGFSVYSEAEAVVDAILSESMPGPDNVPVPWTPSPMTRTLFLQHLISTLSSEQDRSLLNRELLELTALTAPEIDLLTTDARQLRDILRTPAGNNLGSIGMPFPASTQATLERLSPGRALGAIRGRVFLMHDQADTYLPVSEARALAKAGRVGQQITYEEFRLFEHVVPSADGDRQHLASELLRLVRHITTVLGAARAAPRFASDHN